MDDVQQRRRELHAGNTAIESEYSVSTHTPETLERINVVNPFRPVVLWIRRGKKKKSHTRTIEFQVRNSEIEILHVCL